jgi:peptidoglycan/xylan/chitin deacetylase (PgdA/CDA1 family)
VRTVILNFHGVGKPSRFVPADERPYWLSLDKFMAIVDLARSYRERPYSVQFTFDDGNESDLAIACPILRSSGFKGRHFVLAGFLDRPGYLNKESVRELLAAGMTIGTHGVAHPKWTRCDDGQLESEIADSVTILGRAIDTAITEAAIPFGAYNFRVLRALRRHGFSAVYTSDGGTCPTRSWLRPRKSVRADTSLRSIEDLLSGRLSLWQRTRRNLSICRKLVS